MKIRGEIPGLFKIGQKYRALYTKTEDRSIVAGDINSPKKHF
jgi:hypothetical protein